MEKLKNFINAVKYEGLTIGVTSSEDFDTVVLFLEKLLNLKDYVYSYFNITKIKQRVKKGYLRILHIYWRTQQDLNLQPFESESNALSNCAMGTAVIILSQLLLYFKLQ